MIRRLLCLLRIHRYTIPCRSGDMRCRCGRTRGWLL